MKNSNSEKTRKRVINASLRSFVKRGYHGTSISDISNVAKLTKGGIYFHFENKDALLSGILEEYERNFLRKMIEEVESVEGKAIDKLNHFFKFGANFSGKNREMCLCLTNLSTELCGSNKKHERKIREIYKGFRRFIVDLLEEGRKDGSFREDIDPNILALNLIGSCEGNLLQWNMNKSECSKGDFSRSLMKFILNGICKQ